MRQQIGTTVATCVLENIIGSVLNKVDEKSIVIESARDDGDDDDVIVAVHNPPQCIVVDLTRNDDNEKKTADAATNDNRPNDNDDIYGAETVIVSPRPQFIDLRSDDDPEPPAVIVLVTDDDEYNNEEERRRYDFDDEIEMLFHHKSLYTDSGYEDDGHDDLSSTIDDVSDDDGEYQGGVMHICEEFAQINYLWEQLDQLLADNDDDADNEEESDMDNEDSLADRGDQGGIGIKRRRRSDSSSDDDDDFLNSPSIVKQARHM